MNHKKKRTVRSGSVKHFRNDPLTSYFDIVDITAFQNSIGSTTKYMVASFITNSRASNPSDRCFLSTPTHKKSLTLPALYCTTVQNERETRGFLFFLPFGRPSCVFICLVEDFEVTSSWQVWWVGYQWLKSFGYYFLRGLLNAAGQLEIVHNSNRNWLYKNANIFPNY